MISRLVLAIQNHRRKELLVMKREIGSPVQKGIDLIRWRTVLTFALLCTFALITLQTDAVYYKNTVKGPRTSLGTTDRSKIQPTGDPNIVGQLCRDKEGNVIVRWPMWVNGGCFFNGESLVLDQYKTEADFLKVYLEKCEARGNLPKDRRVLGEEYERKRVYKDAGKKMWAENLQSLRAARAKEKKEQ